MKSSLFAAMTVVILWSTISASPRQGTALPTVQVGNAGVLEGNAGTRKVDLCVMLSRPAPGAITVTYASRDGSASAGADYQPANGILSFAKDESHKCVPLNAIGDKVVEGNETFELVLTAATGATIAGGPGVVTIVNDDFPPGQTGLAAYWVQFAYEGSSGSFKGTEGCPVSRLGGAIMNGMVEGSERVPRDDDIEYHGKLWLFTDIELCEADRFNGSSEDKLCAIHALGSADVNAELSVYADSRGGWIKESADPRSVRVKMYGSCTSKLMADEARVYPDNSMANVFNASELKIPSGPLRPGQSYPAADDPHWVFTVIEKIR